MNDHTAHNYHPLPVTLIGGNDVWVTDGRREYLDFLAGYSALNFGHRHPYLIATAKEQLDRLTLGPRAFDTDRLDPFCTAVAGLCRFPDGLVLPMNTGAEAVETAIKVARAWGYRVKGVPDGEAQIIVADGNFHGRTTTIISFSTDPTAWGDFGPYAPGFRIVPYGEAAAISDAINERTVAVLIEPIQGEAGVVIPPDGYLAEIRRLCDLHEVLMIADEVQSGFGRSGRLFACDWENVQPDLYILGKALGGGIMPVSAVAGRRSVIGVIQAGEHGSTFGGNPLAAAIGTAAVQLILGGDFDRDFVANSRLMGEHLAAGLTGLVGRGVDTFRCRGLWAGVDIDPALMTGREVCESMLAKGVLLKDTHGSTVRLSPPLTVNEHHVDTALMALSEVLHEAGA